MTESLLQLREVKRRVGLGDTSIYTAMTAGKFPRPVKVGARAVRWRESDISAWIAARPEVIATGKPAAPAHPTPLQQRPTPKKKHGRRASSTAGRAA